MTKINREHTTDAPRPEPKYAGYYFQNEAGNWVLGAIVPNRLNPTILDVDLGVRIVLPTVKVIYFNSLGRFPEFFTPMQWEHWTQPGGKWQWAYKER